MRTSKYEPTTLPTKEDAVLMADERDEWAKLMRKNDLHGLAKEFELTALLLRFFAEAEEGAATSRDKLRQAATPVVT